MCWRHADASHVDEPCRCACGHWSRTRPVSPTVLCVTRGCNAMHPLDHGAMHNPTVLQADAAHSLFHICISPPSRALAVF